MQKYSIGLDMGTNSLGFAIVGEDGKLINAHGRRGYGVRIFPEGKSAADRRGFRSTKRRLKHRKWRLRLLREFFDEPISSIDPSFFARLKESNMSRLDVNYSGLPKQIFSDRSDGDYYTQYPTIYHLRQKLMTEHRKFDIREIYLAVHHIVKYRGNFLRFGAVKNFKAAQFDLGSIVEEINELLKEVYTPLHVSLSLNNLTEVKEILLDPIRSRRDAQDEIKSLFIDTTIDDKETKTLEKKLVTQVGAALVGSEAKFDQILNVNLDKEDQAIWKFKLDDIDTKLADIESGLTDERARVIQLLNELYASSTLAKIVPEGLTFSESMIEKYQTHRDNLEKWKEYAATLPKKRRNELREIYGRYINRKSEYSSSDLKNFDFYKRALTLLKADMSENQLRDELITKAETESLFPKQRSKENASIPFQVQLQELHAIIENQKEFYPWLAEANPVEDDRVDAPYKLEELVKFRVPYYVGPLVTNNDQKEAGVNQFAWMVRKENGQITPWNFDQKVDKEASENEFIRRMRTTDTYLIGEDVLPKQSLIYQKYEVLNELNNLRVNGRHLKTGQKKGLIEHVFKSTKRATVKRISEALLALGGYDELPVITGLADNNVFTSSMSSYIDYSNILGSLVDNPEKQEDIEKMILWSTIFEDAQNFTVKLKEIDWLTESQRKKIASKRFTGWGNLSRKLLVGLKDLNGNSIMDRLENTSKNFMQIQSSKEFSSQIAEINQENIESTSVEETIASYFTSPQNKKALKEVFLVVDDIIRIMGHQPERIFIEAAREPGQRGRRTQTRTSQIETAYKKVASEIITQSARNELKTVQKSLHPMTDKMVLYFMQGGRDMYTGDPLNIDLLPSYHIDHIMPQAVIKDDSLDNRVLTNSQSNIEKSDKLAADVFGKKMRWFWQKLRESGLMSGKKFYQLNLSSYDFKEQSGGFIARQLVETRQIIKLATELLFSQFSEGGTEIVSLRASLSHDFRQQFGLVKLRQVNNYHHAFDAFLSAFLGTYLYKAYPKLRPLFVYGQFIKEKNFVQPTQTNFIYRLKKLDSVVDKDTGEILWNKQKDIEYLQSVYNYKRVVVVHEPHVNQGAMFNQTLYRKKDNKAVGGKKTLIPAKLNRPSELYGGYSGRTLSYLAIINVHRRKDELQVVGIYTTHADAIRKGFAKSEQEGLVKLRRAIDEYLSVQAVKSQSKPSRNDIPEYEVLVRKMPLDQVVRDRIFGKMHRFALGTNTYYHNVQELFLPLELQRIIYNRKYRNMEEGKKEMMRVYDAILNQATAYFTLYNKNKFIPLLKKGREKFANLPVEDYVPNDKREVQRAKGQRSILLEICEGLHANSVTPSLKFLGIKTPFGMLQSKKITLTPEFELIHQSPCGLVVRKQKPMD